MPRSEPRSRVREPPVHCATQGPPSHALRAAALRAWVYPTVALPPLGPSSLNDQLPVPKAAGPARRTLCRPSADTLKLGRVLLGIPRLERMGGGDRNSDCGFLAIRLESCLIHAHGFCMALPMWGWRQDKKRARIVEVQSSYAPVFCILMLAIPIAATR